jgi:pimeloyl-ACP methyl ester carboxylesterase
MTNGSRKDPSPSERSLASEARAFAEFADLRRDPVYRGAGVARGDGRLVLVLPGLFGNDAYLNPLRGWLRRIGYRPAMSMIAINAGCPERLSRQVEQAFARRLRGYSGTVAIIGHSRGGMLGKALATRLGERCACFIALGSPVGSVMRAGPDGLAQLAAGASSTAAQSVAAPAVVEAGRAAMRWFDPDCNSPLCGCSYVRDLLAPLPSTTRTFAIYSSEDPIVSPNACPIDGAVNLEVRGTHSGLPVNRAVYRHIAAALAER